MLKQVSIEIFLNGYSIKGYTGSDHSEDLILINHQRWKLNQPPFSELISGEQWDQVGLNAKLISALERAAVASSKLARRLEDHCYDPVLPSMRITITPGRIDLGLPINPSKGDQVKPEMLCCYQWDQHRQMLPLEVQQGDLSDLPNALRVDLKEACFGRYGLLARQIERSQAPAVDHPLDQMRWA